MSTWIIVYLIAMTVIAAVNTVIVFRNSERNAHSYSIMFFSLFVCNAGHLFLALSTTTAEANIANKMSYAGSGFLPFFMFCCVLQVCQVRFPSVCKMILFLLSFFIFACVSTVGYSDIYYKSFEYVVASGVGNYRVGAYGFGHDIFNALLVLYLFANVGVIGYAFLKNRNVSYKNLIALSLIESVSVASFLIARQVENDMLLMPGVYVFDQFVLLYLYVKIKRYDLGQSILQSLEEKNTDGYISISSDMKFFGCNDIAYAYFPELRECRVDHSLSSPAKIVQFFRTWALEMKVGTALTEKEYAVDGKFYKCTITKAGASKRKYTALIKIVDNTEYHRYVQMLGSDNSRLQQLAKVKESQVHAIQEQMVVGMANMVESRDSSTGGHIKRTSQVVSILAEELRKEPQFNLSDEFYEALIAAAPMHDLGKIAIDDQILRKPGKFTSEEFSIMKSHAEKGAAIVENLLSQVESPEFVQIAKNMANYHHERYDGSGYPSHLVGENIPIEARIMAIADVYDALVSRRCYKDKMSFDEASRIILESMGSHFDPKLRESFEKCRAALETYYSQVEH